MALYKNVAGQKCIVYAHNAATGLPKTGDAANITAYVSKDAGGAVQSSDVNPTEMDAVNLLGLYAFDLAQAETNADLFLLAAQSSTDDVQIEPVVVYTSAVTTVRAALLDYLDATISSRLASSGYTAPDNAGILAAIAGVAVPGAEMALTGAAIDAIIADMVVALTASGKTPAQALRLILAALLGVSGGMAEGAPTFADIEGNPAIEGVLDDDGNRTEVTLHE